MSQDPLCLICKEGKMVPVPWGYLCLTCHSSLGVKVRAHG